MDSKLQILRELTLSLTRHDGIQDTAIPSFKIIQATKPEKTHQVYKPSLCVIVQGSKDVILGDSIYTYEPGECIVASVDLPVTGHVTEASPKKPYLCLMLELDPTIIFDILKTSPLAQKSVPTKKAIYVEKVPDDNFEAFIRLLKCLKNPETIPVLSPMIIREIVFHMLSTKYGAIVKELGITGGQTHKIRQAIDILKKNFNQPRAFGQGRSLKEVRLDTEVVLKRFEQPDEVRQFELGKFELVTLGGMTIGRATYQPGWKWSEHVGAAQGATSCHVGHVGMVVSGRATAAMDNGDVIEMRAGDIFYIPSGHDSWVIGDEPYVSLHFMGAEDYASHD